MQSTYMISHFISLDTDTWVPSCYWSKFDKQNKPINILEEPRFIAMLIALDTLLIMDMVLKRLYLK
jgi:hypothetical protein